MRKKKSKAKVKPTRAKKTTRRKKPARRRRPRREFSHTGSITAPVNKGVGPETGGQSGDIQGLPHVAEVDSESVEELAEEGQTFEAGVVSGVENAPDADVSEVTTTEVPEDDVPPEYLDRE